MKLPIEAKAPKMKQENNKPEDYELDNHLKTLTDAHAIMQDKKLKKHVLNHAKNKKAVVGKISKLLETPEEETSESNSSEAEEKGEIHSIDGLRARSKKLKSKMFGGE